MNLFHLNTSKNKKRTPVCWNIWFWNCGKYHCICFFFLACDRLKWGKENCNHPEFPMSKVFFLYEVAGNWVLHARIVNIFCPLSMFIISLFNSQKSIPVVVFAVGKKKWNPLSSFTHTNIKEYHNPLYPVVKPFKWVICLVFVVFILLLDIVWLWWC